jgi:hypothetical protein
LRDEPTDSLLRDRSIRTVVLSRLAGNHESLTCIAGKMKREKACPTHGRNNIKSAVQCRALE